MRSAVVIDLGPIKRAHAMVLSRTGLAIQKAAEQAGKEAVQFVKSRPTFTPRTGHLQRSTDYKVTVRRGGKVLQLRNSAKYAASIDKGAKPHIIRPRRAKMLRFMVGGAFVFARQVNHPGNKPYKFLRSAVNIAGPAWFHDIESAMTRIAKNFR